jgi:hypothetical protein
LIIIQCHSQEIVNGIWRSPGVYENIQDDYTPSPDQCDIQMGGMIHLVPFVGNQAIGDVSFRVKSAIMVEAHIAILPKYQARYAFRAAKMGIEWIWQNTHVRKIISMTPDTLPHIKKFILKLGFELEGVNKCSFLKDGVLYNQYYGGLVRPKEWVL